MSKDRVELRESLRNFAELMESRLGEKDSGRGARGWSEYHPLWVFNRAEECMAELKDELMRGSTDNILRQAADVANFCMMIADIQVNYREGKKVRDE